MKKLFLFLGFIGLSSLGHANTIDIPSSMKGSDTLSGLDAYAWGISIPLTSGETVSSAEIDFTGIKLTASGNSQGTGTLYTDLLNRHNTGITTATDNDAPGDYWATKYFGANITSLGSEFFASVGTSLTWKIVLSATELTALNTYLSNGGTFDIGIDPDCHFSVSDIDFNYTVSTTSTNNDNTVPDAATTAFLLVLGLGAVEIFRRQYIPGRNKA